MWRTATCFRSVVRGQKIRRKKTTSGTVLKGGEAAS
ncbi:hypothetical protein Pint_07831 [Pistacia integerrima]|uniref:Uncharacterized protein n=1 Tax=Pistacia integerrima TaxID=434235 RepID=A0ACC0XWS8_9ROSI|nr:hypothetical protein Pint_07831 [Pistacia integerrima]